MSVAGKQGSGKGGKGGSGGKSGDKGAQGGSSDATGGTDATAGSDAGAGGQSGNGGAGGEGGATTGEGGAAAGEGGSGGTVVVGGKSALPVPPTSGLAKPSGTPGNLKVVDWAGFSGALTFTFDDSLQSQIDNYAALNAVGVPMTFYLVCGNDGGKPAWQTAANDGHELGNHTMHHCNTSPNQQDSYGCGWGSFTGVDAELDDCQTHLETAYGIQGPYSMAAPMGDGGWQIPASSRFLLNRGVNDVQAGVKPNDDTNPYNLPCHIAAEGETAAGGFNLVTDDVETHHSWRIILNHSLSPSTRDGYHPVDPAEVVAAMTYARDKGDLWVDTLISVGAYWRAQKVLSAVAAVEDGDDLVYSWTLPDHFPPGQYLRVKVDGGTVKQLGTELSWDEHGYYEITLDAGSLTISP
jgi:peptidoglycan/xylan/chitin deacetylase (PgdA/CDA1 family)